MSVASTSCGDYISPEELSPNDTIACLYSKDASEKCRIGLTDTIVFEAGIPASWYYTGKTGEILKKRNVDMNTVSQRWMKIGSQFDDSRSSLPRELPVAIMRQKSGVTKFLGFDSWDQFIRNCKTSPDESVVSVHCYVKGKDKTYYRNRYTVKDSLGRFVTSTQSYVFKANNVALDTIQVYHDHDIQYTDSHVTALRNIMDLATNTVVRYMEKMLNVRVLNIAIDFAIDKRSQLWMLWSSDVWLVRTSSLLNVTNWFNRAPDENSRMSWAGLKFEEDYRDMSQEGRMLMGRDNYSSTGTGSVTSAPRDATGAIHPQKITSHYGDQTGYHHPIKHMEIERDQVNVASGSEQVYEAMNTVSETKSNRTFRAKGNIASSHVMLAAEDSVANKRGQNADSVVQEPNSPGPGLNGFVPKLPLKNKEELAKTNYPDPLKCKGDYCQVIMHAVGPLYMDPELKKEHATPLDKFFSREELSKLQNQPKFSDVIKLHANSQGGDTTPLGTLQIMMKSLVLARRERRGVFASNVNRDAWKHFPITPRSEKTLRDHLNELRANGTLSYDDDSELSMELKTIGSRNKRGKEENELGCLVENKNYVDSFTKTLPQYYEQVCVCDRCYHIYHLLDWAREALKQQVESSSVSRSGMASAGKGKRRSGRNKMSASVDDNSKLTMPGPENPEGIPKAKSFKSESVKHDDKSGKGSRRRGRDKSKASSLLMTPDTDTVNTEDLARGRVTWKDYDTGPIAKEASDEGKDNKFADLDDYLRSGAQSLASKKAREKEHVMRERLSKLQQGSINVEDPGAKGKLLSSKSFDDIYHGKVLFACPESNDHALSVLAFLEESLFQVYWIKDGRQATSELLYRMDNFKYDCVLIERNLPLDNAVTVTTAVRDHEREARKALAAKLALRGRGDVPKSKRLPVICFTNETTPDDLKHYMKADMDGCVSFPVNKMSLLDTIRAAIPHHLAELQTKMPKASALRGEEEPIDELEEFEMALRNAKANESKAYKLNSMGVMEGSLDSATAAAASMPISQANEEDYSINGVVQIDADTRIPYMVLDASKTAKVLVNPKKPFFNVVICHDLFDTAEKMKIFFKPIVEKYLGMQVLVWNYPGQAFTEFRSEQLLNNEYHAVCLNELLGQVGSKGTQDFDTERPFYVLGYGFGVAVASFYLAHFRVPNVRGFLSVNGWSFLDSYLAGIMHARFACVFLLSFFVLQRVPGKSVSPACFEYLYCYS